MLAIKLNINSSKLSICGGGVNRQPRRNLLDSGAVFQEKTVALLLLTELLQQFLILGFDGFSELRIILLSFEKLERVFLGWSGKPGISSGFLQGAAMKS